MNGRERFNATLKFQEIDRAFRWEASSFWPKTLENFKQQGLPENIEDIDGYFGMDPIGWIPVEGGWAGLPYCPMFEQVVLEQNADYVIVREPDGIVKKRKSLIGYADETAPQLLEYPVKTREDFEALKWRMDPGSMERLPRNWADLTKEYEKRDYPLGMMVLGIFGFIRSLLGDGAIMYMVYDDPAFLRELGAFYSDFYPKYIELVCKSVVPDFIMMWEDTCYNNGPLVSPELYRDIMAPYLKQVISAAKEHGIEGIIVDCDGDLRKMLPIYLECGANAFFPMEVRQGTDIVELRAKYGNRFAMIGGVDKTLFLEGIDKVYEEVDRKVPKVLATGGYIPALDHNCPPYVTLQDFYLFVERVRSAQQRR